MRGLPTLFGPFLKESTICRRRNRSPWVVPRAIYVTDNPCFASRVTLLRMQQVDDKCCHKPGSSCRTQESVSGMTMSHNINLDATCCSKDSSAALKLDDQYVPNQKTTPSAIVGKPQFYRRVLPSTCVAFGSPDGKLIFGEALLAGHMNCYFPLAAQFRTQEEPAFCGLTTLVMVLNALAVDPGRIWKGPWRWYHENMLDCCVPLSKIETQGITLEQFNCLAACNGLNVQTVRPDLYSPTLQDDDLNKFRELVKKMSQREDAFIVSSYSRRLLSQTGDGHFSPIGGYHPERDLVLILDTARFKYPPHWVPLKLLWDAMLAIDKETGLNRGFSLVQRLDSLFKAESQLIFKPSEYFSVNAPAHHRASVKRFVLGFEAWAVDCTSPIGPAIVQEGVEKLIQYVGERDDDFHIFATREDGRSCSDSKAPVSIPLRNSCLMSDLMSAIKTLPIYSIVDETLKMLSENNNNPGHGDASLSPAAIPTHRIGRTGTSRTVVCESADCRAAAPEVNDVGASEFATMFLLSWPFDEGDAADGSQTNNLRAYVEGALKMPLPPILQQEIAMLRHQLRQIKAMFLD